MALERITEEFVKSLAEVERLTGADPRQIAAAAAKHPHVKALIEKLNSIYLTVEQLRKFGANKFIVQAHEGFLDALRTYEGKWQNAWMELLTSNMDLSELADITSQDNISRVESDVKALDEDDDWEKDRHEDDTDFDPQWHSASSDISAILEASEWKAKDIGLGFFGRGPAAFIWLQEAIGTGFKNVQERRSELDLWVVKKSVSDGHRTAQKYGLYIYLKQATSCYLVGADLAAIALCRASTELIIKRHYFHSPDNPRKLQRARLIPLVELLCKDKEDIKYLNLGGLIRTANEILHSPPKADISSSDPTRQIVRDWLKSLQKLIQSAPDNPEFYK